jgi:large subunit ribosomal protein L23
MATKKTTKTVKATTKKEATSKTFDVILSPRITEKGAISAESNAYIFNVSVRATKTQIAQAIEQAYKVIPRKIGIVKYPGKNVFSKGKRGRTAGGKKAYVFLKKGEQIQVI